MMGKHNTGLDGIRWFAFLGVFLFHADVGVFRYGSYGVEVFFVLSGFLIGRILLSLREESAPLSERLKQFYIRRSLRIFPLYYFVLLLIFVLPHLGVIHESRQHLLPYHALYLTNFYIFFSGEKIDSHTHFWSLDVEEHFYLLAPMLLLLLPLKRVEKGIIGIMVCVVAARLANYFLYQHPRLMYVSMMQFDILGMGIATAFIEQKGAFARITEERLLKAGALCACAALIVIIGSCFNLPLSGFFNSVLFPTLLAIASAAFILMVWKEKQPPVNRLLSWPPFTYLGKISYGLYVYHNFAFIISRNSTGLRHIVLTLVALVATIIAASLSWHLLESPINNLKRYFPYKSPQAQNSSPGHVHS